MWLIDFRQNSFSAQKDSVLGYVDLRKKLDACLVEIIATYFKETHSEYFVFLVNI